MAMNRESGAMVIDGHILSDRELEVFWAFHEVGTLIGASKKMGVSTTVVKRIVESPWARKLFDTKVKARNESFMHRIQEKDDKALAAYDEILSGERSADKSTMAQAKLIEVRMKAGKEPILDTRNVTTNIKNEQHNTAVFLTEDQIRGMTPEELIQLNRTGLTPARFLKEEPAPPALEFPEMLPVDIRAVQTVKRNKRKAELTTEADAPSGH